MQGVAGTPSAGAFPPVIKILAFVAIATSSIVLIEPAPTDMVFVLLMGAAVLVGPQTLRFQGIGFVILFGLAAFVVGNLVSMAMVINAPHSIRYVAITFFLMAMFLVLVGLIGRLGPRFGDFCLRAFCIAALITSVIGILARFRLIPNPGIFFLDGYELRIRSTFKDANVFAPFVVGALLIVLNDYVTGRLSALSTALHGIVYLMAVLFAFSRGAFANLALALFIYAPLCFFMVRDRALKRRLTVAMCIGGFLAVCALVYALALADLGEFLDKRMSMQGYDRKRFAMLAKAFSVAVDHPLGIGPGEWVIRHHMDPHNVYLRILAENGVIGLIGFLAWCGGSVLKGFAGIVRRSPHAPVYAACIAVILGVLGESIIIDTLHWRHLFFFLAIPVGYRVYELSEARRRPA